MLPSLSRGQDHPLLGLHARRVVAQQAHDDLVGERLQGKPAAARADGRQQAARGMRHHEQHGVGRRLLEDLQHGIGAVAVHLVGRIDDGDPPFAHRRRHVHEGAELTHVVDGDLGAHAAGVGIERAPEMKQVGMRARIDQRSSGRVGRHIETVRFAEQASLGLAAQQEAREAPGKRCLADAARSRQQPGMVQAAALLGGEHGLFRRLVAQQAVAAPGRRPVVRPFELLELARIRARLASGHPLRLPIARPPRARWRRRSCRCHL